VGLLAIGPIDAIEISVSIDDITLKQPGVMGSTIIEGQTTMLVDIFEIVDALFPEWFEDREVLKLLSKESSHHSHCRRFKLFRNQVRNYMTESGYEVIEGEDGAIAWDLLQEHSDDISIVVTDIEMPNMNGFELTETIRKDPRFAKIPIIALTTLAGEEDIAKGKAVGVDEYHIKLDKEKLMASVHHYIKQLH